MWSSAVSGAIAACSGMLGKFSSDDSTSMLHVVQETCMSMATEVSWLDCAYVSVGVRVLFFVAMLLSNAVMLNFFVQGLHETDSLTATITSSAINFVVTVDPMLGRHVAASMADPTTVGDPGPGHLPRAPPTAMVARRLHYPSRHGLPPLRRQGDDQDQGRMNMQINVSTTRTTWHATRGWRG